MSEQQQIQYKLNYMNQAVQENKFMSYPSSYNSNNIYPTIQTSQMINIHIMDGLNNNINYDQGCIQNNTLLRNNNNKVLDYYQEYKKLYSISYYLNQQKIKQIQLKYKLLKRIISIQNSLQIHNIKIKRNKQEEEQEFLNENDDKNKRLRRQANQIQRKFICEAQYCSKCYGSQGSLQQHIKLKHNNENQKRNNL